MCDLRAAGSIGSPCARADQLRPVPSPGTWALPCRGGCGRSPRGCSARECPCAPRVREGVDALHEASVDLDLLQLVAVRHVAVAVELVDQCGYTVVEELALLLPLRLLAAAAGGARLAVEAGRRGVVGCGHGGQVRLGIAIEAADGYIVLRRTGKGRSCTETAWFEKDVPTTRGSSAVVR